MMFPEKKKIYFASDLHLGMYPLEESREREKHIVAWLNSIEDSMLELWLLGDIFDYWFEYAKVVPKGFTRFLGKLADLSDKGIPVHVFTGNHDVWMFKYLQTEIGATIHHHHLILELGEKTFYLAHGDGLTSRDNGYLFLKSVFTSRFLQWCYARIHPNTSTAFAQWWSKKSRYGKGFATPFKGDENEEQVLFSKAFLADNPDIDLFIYGHRHIPYDISIGEDKHVICLGDWIFNFSYGEFDGQEFKIQTHKPLR